MVSRARGAPPRPRRRTNFILSLVAAFLAVAVAPSAATATATAAGRQADPTPHSDADATQAGTQAATTPVPDIPVPTGSFVTYRVFATQYQPHDPASVEVAIPDKCAKFAALKNTGALSTYNCPAGYSTALDYRVIVTRSDGRSEVFPVKDVGPWNVDDNYWDPSAAGSPRPRRLFGDLATGKPESTAAFSEGYNTLANCKDLEEKPTERTAGSDQFGRCVLNPAGIDLSFAAAAKLGLRSDENAFVNVTFLWEPVAAGTKPALNRLNVRYLRQTRTSGPADFSYTYGDPADFPLMGDWDGNGTKTPGVFRAGTWFLRNSNSTGVADAAFGYGNPLDYPVVGDWNGDGVDTVGIFRGGTWYFRNSNSTGVADATWGFGDPGDTPIVGDWNGNGTDTFGVVRRGVWYVANYFDPGVADVAWGYGNPEDTPVVGDWDNDGDSTAGIFRDGQWYISNSLGASTADVNFHFGDPGDRLVPWH
ncbi:MAG: hypothetical protein QOE93_1799 [Actinomycetota bacterium]|jgi:hypothetical protein|nr:hypothetical protein [Actinomycetota bacterium]